MKRQKNSKVHFILKFRFECVFDFFLPLELKEKLGDLQLEKEKEAKQGGFRVYWTIISCNCNKYEVVG